MQGTKTELNIYVALVLVYEFLSATIHGGLVASLCNYVVFAWSFIYFFKTVSNFQKEPAVVKALAVFYLALAIYGVIILVEGKTFMGGLINARIIPSTNYLYKASWSLLPIFVFYDFAKKGQLTKQFMLKWIYVFGAVAMISYYAKEEQAMLRRDAEEVTNNAGYLIISLLPMFVFLKDRSKAQYLLIAGTLILALQAMKRGAILVGLLAVAIHFWYLLRNAKKTIKIEVFLALLIVSFAVSNMFDRLEESSEYFQERVEDTMEGETSGRDVIHGFLIDYYLNEYTPLEQLLGRGGNATLEVYGMFAHNDWIELAINQGLLGMLLYLFFWIAFVKLLFKKNIPPEIRTSLAMIFAIYFLMTFFSMSYSGYTLYSSMVLGYGIAVACDAGKAKKKYLLGLK